MDKNKKIIVSLTSFPEAIPYAVKAIQTILDGTILPDKIVLYLDSFRFPKNEVPDELKVLKLNNPIIDVRFDSMEIRSYKKLIPALKDFPNDIIVTIDDDIYYHKNILKDLIKVHKKYPNAIIAHRVRKIKLNKPYSKWGKYKWYDFVFKKYHFSHLAMQTGVGSVLYPPNSLDEKMLNPQIFMKLAPSTDDVWFWAAAVSKGTYVVPVPFGKNRAIEIGKPVALSLKTINLKPNDDRNRKALERILDFYPGIKNTLLEE